MSPSSRAARPLVTALLCLVLGLAGGTASAQTDTMYFPAVDNVTNVLVQRINAETVRIDMSAWYLTEHSVSIALLNRFQAGVPVRLIGDRGAIFEIDPKTKAEFYWLASYGVPIRLRYNPTWYPEIDHWKATVFVGQNLVEFGSANYTPFQLAPSSATNYSDETAWLTGDPAIVGAFKTKFDQIWNDTTTEPQSVYGGPPYLKNWNDACALESACADYSTTYPNPAVMTINTARLEPNRTMPADLIWGQGPDFNNRVVQEIDNEATRVDLVVYRLTVDNITQALLSKFQSGVPVRLIIEPAEYLNRKWPEFWITHANLDKLWAAGVAIKQRQHQGITHMKTLITSTLRDEWLVELRGGLAAGPQLLRVGVRQADDLQRAEEPLPDDVGRYDGLHGFRAAAPRRPRARVPVQRRRLGVDQSHADLEHRHVCNQLRRLPGNVESPASPSWPTSRRSWSTTRLPRTRGRRAAALAAGTTYYWRVVSRTNATPRNPNLVAGSPTWSFTTGGSQSTTLPAGWVDQDIGSVAAAGSASYASGTFTVKGDGADIWGTADAFNFAYTTLSGDGEIVARVTSLQNTDAFAKAGVMLRETAAAGSAHVVLDVRPGGSVEFMKRSASGGTTTYLAGATQSIPGWLKLSRSGTTVTASVSSNGSTWTVVGSATVSMGSSLLAGLAVCSHTTGATTTATFDNVGVSTGGGGGGGGLPTPWQNQDVGSTGVAGSASYASGQFTVTGAGADIWGTADAFQYVYQPLSGDGQIVARVTSLQNTNTYAKAGVMLRETLAAGSRHVILDATPGGGVEFMSRAATNGSTSYLGGATMARPVWLRLTRSGSTITSAVSADGAAWTTVGSTTVSMATAIYAGLAVSSHSTTVTTTATFDNVSVGAGGTPPPPPPSAPDIVIYASDVPAAGIHGSWSATGDATSPNGVSLATSDLGWSAPNAPLAAPSDYVDVSFSAVAATPYRVWLRLKALNNSKYNDSVWVQFSGAQAYAIGGTSGLLVNLATDGTGASISGWGWQNGAYWLSQDTTVTFATSGTKTIRIQVREDGVQFDQIVLSPSRYFSSAPGGTTNDSTIVSK